MPVSGCIYNTHTVQCLIFKIRGLSRYTRYKAAGREREITAVQVATVSCLAYSHFRSFLHLKKQVAGQKIHEEKEVEKNPSHCADVRAGGRVL